MVKEFQQTLDYLYSALPMFHRVGAAAYKENLDNTFKLCDLLGNPEKGLVCIHVAGTNGKGSTSTMLAAIFKAAGYKVGLYTSPHLKDFRERIRVDGVMVEQKWITNFVDQYKKDFDVIKPSFFEMCTAMAFKYFADQHTDICIIETGLGGRLDSTNVVKPLVSVITNISYDHMNLLGDTLPKIAVEKAGIIKEHIPVVIGEYQEEVAQVFQSKADELKSNLVFASKVWTIESLNYKADTIKFKVLAKRVESDKTLTFDFKLIGTYQLKNIATVLETIHTLRGSKYELSHEQLKAGLETVNNDSIAGRWQMIGNDPLVIADTAHNEAGIKYVLDTIATMKYNQLHIVLGVVNDKDLDKILKLFPKEALYYFCKANIPRGLDASILRDKAAEFNLLGKSYFSVRKAYSVARKQAGKNDLIFIGGSTFTVAEVV